MTPSWQAKSFTKLHRIAVDVCRGVQVGGLTVTRKRIGSRHMF